ncbi:MAG TPA: MFS transporter, partial [Gaiellales bacterium]|nr:MFS transporter [Gaiellales bacterium]
MTLDRINTPVTRLAVAQGVAYAGRGAAMTALIWRLYELSGSSWWVSGAMLAVFGVSTVLSPWSGHLGDRHDRRQVVLVSALIAAAGFALCVPLSLLGWLTPIVMVMIAAASTQGALSAAVQGAIPNLVDDDELGNANSLAGAWKSAGFMLGPGVGGLLLAVIGPAGVFAASSVALVGAAALVWRLEGRFRTASTADHAGSKMDGYRMLLRDPWMRLLTISWALVMAGIGPVIVAEVVLAKQFAVGSTGYGLIAVFWDGGGVVGALLGRGLSRRAERPAVVGGLVAIAAGLATVGLTPVFWPVLAGMAVAGLFDAFGVVAAQNIIQRRTPDHVRSRVSAALDAVVLGTMSLSFALGAPLVEWVGAQGVYLLSAAICLVGAMLLLPTLGGVPDIPRRARGFARAVGGSPRSASRALRGVVERRSPGRSAE